MHIEAATLEVRDKDKVATFSGDVKVKQGDTGLRCKSLVVFYEQGGDGGAKGKDHAGCRRPAPAASRRSSGWKRAAGWW